MGALEFCHQVMLAPFFFCLVFAVSIYTPSWLMSPAIIPWPRGRPVLQGFRKDVGRWEMLGEPWSGNRPGNAGSLIRSIRDQPVC